MREKMKTLPIPVTILIAVGVMVGFVCILTGLGSLIGLIPNLDKASPYMGQMLCEILLSIYGAGLICFFGQTDILKSKGEGWLKSIYIAGFFVGYIFYDFVAQLFVQAMQPEHELQPFVSVAVFTITMLLVGFAEEIVFRGVILNLFLDRFPNTKGGIVAAIIADGICFGGLHLINLLSGANPVSVIVQVITAGFMGATFAALYVRTRNIWVCMLAHGLIDFATLFWGTLYQGTDLVGGINNISWINLIAIPVFLVPILILLRKSKLQEAVKIAGGETVDSAETDALPVAIVSLIMGIASIVSGCVGYFIGLGVVGLLGSILSLRYKKEGNKLAQAARIVSIVGIVVNVIGIILMVAVELPMVGSMDMEDVMQQFQELQNMQ